MSPYAISALIFAIKIALPISLFFGIIFLLLIYRMKKHPLSGTVAGKAQKNGQFLLYIHGSKGEYTWISTNELRWSNTLINDLFQMDIPGGDWYNLSM